MNRPNPWNPLRPNNPLTSGNPERDWLTRVHSDAPQPDQENTRRPIQDFLKRQATGDSGWKRAMQTAGKFVRKAAELVALGQIPLADQMLFHDWLHPNGKLDMSRATYLAQQEQYYYQQYNQESGPKRVEEAEMHFLKSFIKEISKIGDDDGEHRHKKSHKKKVDNKEAVEAYKYGKQDGEEEEYYRNAYYRNKHYRDLYYQHEENLEDDPKNAPLG